MGVQHPPIFHEKNTKSREKSLNIVVPFNMPSILTNLIKDSKQCNREYQNFDAINVQAVDY